MSTDNENVLETELLEFSDEELKIIHAGAAIACIHGNYSKKNSSISHPPEEASYLECIQFYKENYQSAEALLRWFKENQSTIENWSEKNHKIYLERWKEVAKAELQSVVTLDNIKKLGVGKVSRIFNDAPVEDVLFPYELKKIMDGFILKAKKTQNMKTASDQMMVELADVFNKRFIETGLLSDIIDDHQKKGEEEYTTLLTTTYGDGIFSAKKDVSLVVEQYTQNLKKDLMCSFLQPLGNFTMVRNPGVEMAGRQIAYNKFQYIFLKNIEEGLENGKTVDHTIKSIKENPQKFKFIENGDTGENDYENMLLDNNEVDRQEFFSPTALSFFSNLREKVSAIFAFLFLGKKNDNSPDDDLEPRLTEAVFTPLVEASLIEQNKDETDSDLSRYSLARRIPSSEMRQVLTENIKEEQSNDKKEQSNNARSIKNLFKNFFRTLFQSKQPINSSETPVLSTNIKKEQSSYATSMSNLFSVHFSLNPVQSKQPIHSSETHDKIVQDLEKKHPDVVHLLERLDDAILKQKEKIVACTEKYEVAKSNHSPSLEELKAERDKNTELYENLNRSYNNISFLLDDYDEKRKKTDFERAEKILKETDPMNNSKENEKTGSFEKQRPLSPQSVEEVQAKSTHKILFSKKPATAALFKGDDTNTNTNTTPSSENLNSLRQPM